MTIIELPEESDSVTISASGGRGVSYGPDHYRVA